MRGRGKAASGFVDGRRYAVEFAQLLGLQAKLEPSDVVPYLLGAASANNRCGYGLPREELGDSYVLGPCAVRRGDASKKLH